MTNDSFWKIAINSYSDDINSSTLLRLRNKEDGSTNEWYTPKNVVDALLNSGQLLDAACGSGKFMQDEKWYFDLDPASSESELITKISKQRYTKETNGLVQDWGGKYTFMNPPFSKDLFIPFIRKFIDNNNGILLVFEKPSATTKKLIIPNCSAILTFKRKINFISPVNPGHAQKPMDFTALYAFGEKAMKHLHLAKQFLSEYEPELLFTEKGLKSIMKSL